MLNLIENVLSSVVHFWNFECAVKDFVTDLPLLYLGCTPSKTQIKQLRGESYCTLIHFMRFYPTYLFLLFDGLTQDFTAMCLQVESLLTSILWTQDPLKPPKAGACQILLLPWQSGLTICVIVPTIMHLCSGVSRCIDVFVWSPTCPLEVINNEPRKAFTKSFQR